jgi:hypothetical protein
MEERHINMVTVLLCCNAYCSEKLRPLVVGKFEKSRCTTGVKHDPCNYKASKNAWVTGKIFREWLLCLERNMASKNRNILLLLDQCSAHNHEGLTLKHVHLLHLPANSNMQQRDQGIIYCLKHAYWKRLESFLLHETERNIPTTDIRKWNVMDAMRGITVAWDSITSTVIQNCFSKCGFGIEDAVVTTEDDQDNSNWVELQGQVDFPSNFDEFLNVDQMIPTNKDHTATSLDVPDSKHMEYGQEDEVEGERM